MGGEQKRGREKRDIERSVRELWRQTAREESVYPRETTHIWKKGFFNSRGSGEPPRGKDMASGHVNLHKRKKWLQQGLKNVNKRKNLGKPRHRSLLMGGGGLIWECDIYLTTISSMERNGGCQKKRL